MHIFWVLLYSGIKSGLRGLGVSGINLISLNILSAFRNRRNHLSNTLIFFPLTLFLEGSIISQIFFPHFWLFFILFFPPPGRGGLAQVLEAGTERGMEGWWPGWWRVEGRSLFPADTHSRRRGSPCPCRQASHPHPLQCPWSLDVCRPAPLLPSHPRCPRSLADLCTPEENWAAAAPGAMTPGAHGRGPDGVSCHVVTAVTGGTVPALPSSTSHRPAL